MRAKRPGVNGIGAKRLRGQTGFGAKRPGTLCTYSNISVRPISVNCYHPKVFRSPCTTSAHVLVSVNSKVEYSYSFYNTWLADFPIDRNG